MADPVDSWLSRVETWSGTHRQTLTRSLKPDHMITRLSSRVCQVASPYGTTHARLHGWEKSMLAGLIGCSFQNGKIVTLFSPTWVTLKLASSNYYQTGAWMRSLNRIEDSYWICIYSNMRIAAIVLDNRLSIDSQSHTGVDVALDVAKFMKPQQQQVQARVRNVIVHASLTSWIWTGLRETGKPLGWQVPHSRLGGGVGWVPERQHWSAHSQIEREQTREVTRING